MNREYERLLRRLTRDSGLAVTWRTALEDEVAWTTDESLDSLIANAVKFAPAKAFRAEKPDPAWLTKAIRYLSTNTADSVAAMREITVPEGLSQRLESVMAEVEDFRREAKEIAKKHGCTASVTVDAANHVAWSVKPVEDWPDWILEKLPGKGKTSGSGNRGKLVKLTVGTMIFSSYTVAAETLAGHEHGKPISAGAAVRKIIKSDSNAQISAVYEGKAPEYLVKLASNTPQFTIDINPNANVKSDAKSDAKSDS